MNEKPILFNSEMVRAILDGRKTQTRRVVKPQPNHLSPVTPHLRPNGEYTWVLAETGMGSGVTTDGFKCPYGRVGDCLWVRETWSITTNINRLSPWPNRPHKLDDPPNKNSAVIYRADGKWQWTDEDGGMTDRSYWRPSIHMPRWASRITLEITDVRVERLQDISDGDAAREGVPPNWCGPLNGWSPEEHRYLDIKHIDLDDDIDEAPYFLTAREAFVSLWDSFNAKRGYSWGSNPWVWVYEFKVLGSMPKGVEK